MNQRFLSAPPAPKTAYVARVSYSESGGFGAVRDAERRDIPVFAPAGMRYRPREGDRALMLPGEGQELCAGVLCDASGLAPGELELTGPEGSSLRFLQNGDIALNGVIITKNGQLIPRGSAPEGGVA
jgi:hypothetical protein